MEVGIGTLVLLGALALALAVICVRRPRMGIGIAILLFIPAPLFPTEDYGWVFYGFGGFTLLVLLGWLWNSALHTPPFQANTTSDKIESSLKVFLALCALGLPLSLLFNEGTLNDRLFFYAKGVLPFAYLSLYFVVRSLPFTVRQAQRIVNCLLFVAIVFAVLSYGIYAVTGGRVTWFYAPLAFPFVVLGANVTFAHTLLARTRPSITGWAALTGVLAIAVLLTFTKSQIIAMTMSFALIAYLVSRHSETGTISRLLAFTAATAVCATALVAFASSQTNSDVSLSELVAMRMNDESSTESRTSEWTAALRQFAESPIFGKGIGYQLERDAGDDTVTTGYVHSQVAYIAMTMGIAGLVTYSMLIYRWAGLAHRFDRVAAAAVGPLAAIHGCVLTLGVFALTFASFRTIQHNILIGVLLALAVVMTPNDETALQGVKRTV